MVLLGELLLLIGTILLIIVAFLIEFKIGLTVTGVAFLIWGLTLLYVVGKTPSEPPK